MGIPMPLLSLDDVTKSCNKFQNFECFFFEIITVAIKDVACSKNGCNF